MKNEKMSALVLEKKQKSVGQSLVESLSHDGRGIARPNGKTTFIFGALPNETVTFTYTRKKKDYDEAKMLSYDTPSPMRVTPRCSQYGVCGGCSLQHISPTHQMTIKQETLLSSLARIGKVEPRALLEPLTDAVWHYRHKARLGVRYVHKKNAVLIGFREKFQPNFLTDMQTCEVLESSLSALIPKLRAFIGKLEMKCEIPQIEVAVGSQQKALVFRHLVPLSKTDLQRFLVFGETEGWYIFLQSGGKSALNFLYPGVGEGFLQYALEDLPITYDFHPLDFTQIHPGMNQKMIRAVLTALDLKSHDVLLDLFSGLGNFSLPASFFCKAVIGVEGSSDMTERAKRNAQKNGRENLTFYTKDLDEAAPFSGLSLNDVTHVLIDPPRTGALSVVQNISKTNASRMVYVSCNPATLARDSGVLVHQFGWKLVSAGVMDMFPHTSHVESLAIFERGL